MTYRPHSKYASNSAKAGPWSTCDRCGFIWSQSDLQWQFDYVGGPVPQSQGWLVCDRCINPLTLQRQLLILPPDPPPIFNTRPENYTVDESNWLTTQDDNIITTQDGELFITAIPNPSNAANTSQLACSIVSPGGSVSAVYLDLFNGNPSAGGASVLATITGSSVRTDIASQLTTSVGIATNTSPIVVVSASAAVVNVSWVGLYSASVSGALLMSGTCSVSPTIALDNPVQFDSLGLSINLN